MLIGPERRRPVGGPGYRAAGPRHGGVLLVPALGFVEAFVAIVIGSVVGVGLLALAASIGARHGVPTMVLFRPVLGIRGSWLPSVLNVMQLIGWTAVELWAMSYVADLVVRGGLRFLGSLAVARRCGRDRLYRARAVGAGRRHPHLAREVRRVGDRRHLARCHGPGLTTDGIGDVLTASGVGGFPTFGPALDLVIAMPISWLPLVADYTRFAARPGCRVQGDLLGLPRREHLAVFAGRAPRPQRAGAPPRPRASRPAILAIAGGSVAGILFLVGLSGR